LSEKTSRNLIPSNKTILTLSFPNARAILAAESNFSQITSVNGLLIKFAINLMVRYPNF
jgi:hypothetical protein